jgi:hypothetical protein
MRPERSSGGRRGGPPGRLAGDAEYMKILPQFVEMQAMVVINTTHSSVLFNKTKTSVHLNAGINI